ncbi:MAG: hypothetical protein JRM82_01940 [Nitrososphaerota archaeon]|nr:hypothetical protein [Nitrososphaerota archaeon]
MGRTRTLQGTKMIPLRISTQLIKALDELAKEGGESRNTMMSRLLAAEVLRRQRSRAGKDDGEEA